MTKGEIILANEMINNEFNDTAILKAVNRLIHAGVLGKLSKGVYYKVIFDQFGEVKPTEMNVIKNLYIKTMIKKVYWLVMTYIGNIA